MFNSRKFIGGVIGITFVMAAFFGAHFAMNMDSQGMMKNCPFLGHVQNVCTMTVNEHITKWKQLFTATTQSSAFLFGALLLMGFAFVAFALRFSLFKNLHFQVFSRAGPPEYSSGFLLRAFGRGVLRKRE